jgi:hypothetical protein
MGEEPGQVTTPADIEASRAALSRDIDELNDKVNPVRAVERRKEAVKGRLGSVKEKVMGSPANGSGLGGSASSAKDAVSDKASGALDTVSSKAQGNPLAAGLIAFGAGMLVSALIPASETESRAAQQAVGAIKDSGLVEEAKSVGQEMGQDLKDSAVESAQQVKASAQDSVETVKQEGQSSAQSVKEQATP